MVIDETKGSGADTLLLVVLFRLEYGNMGGIEELFVIVDSAYLRKIVKLKASFYSNMKAFC